MNSEVPAGLKALLVEDDALGRLTMRRALERIGCLVAEADTCGSAERAWSAGSFDIVFLDCRLPDGNGTDLLSRMRRAGRDDRVVAVTAETEQLSVEERRRLNIARVLRKPVNVAELEDCLRETAGIRPADAAGRQRGGPARVVGRYRVFVCGDNPAEGELRNTLRSADSVWVALDMVDVSALSNAASRFLADLAAELRERGGGLCLTGVAADVRDCLVGHGLGDEADMAESVGDLLARSRRLTSSGERASVLGSVVE